MNEPPEHEVPPFMSTTPSHPPDTSPSEGRAERWRSCLVSLAPLLALPLLLGLASPVDGQLEPGLGGATFDAAWERIRDTHYDPAMGGIDWEGVRDELRPVALGAGSMEALRGVLQEMLARLGDSHFALIPEGVAELLDPALVPPPTELNGTPGDPGMTLRRVEGELVVTALRAGGGAAAVGVRTGWVLEAIGPLSVDSLEMAIREGAPPGREARYLDLWLPARVDALLGGPAGSDVALRFRLADGSRLDQVVPRTAGTGTPISFGNLPVPPLEIHHTRLEAPGVPSVGVLRLSAWFPPALERVGEAMQSLGGADGIVLDLRGNPGGLAAMAMGIGGHFLSEPVSLGTMTTRDTELRFPVNPQRVAPDGSAIAPFTGPLAILVDPLTASTSEVFAGGMQGLRRAVVFGEATAGQALPALVSTLPNGDRLLHAVADFLAPGGTRLEGAGVIPDVPVAPTRAALLTGRDPVMEAAVAWIRSGAPPPNLPSSTPESEP